MKTIQIASLLGFSFNFIGCQVLDDAQLREDLLAFGMVCLFTLIYSSHLVGVQNEKKNGK